MAGKKYNDKMYSFNGTFCSREDMLLLSFLFERYEYQCAQADISELIDLQRYRLLRRKESIKKILRRGKDEPFRFVVCMN